VPSASAPVPAPDPEPARHPQRRAPKWPRGPTPPPPPLYRSPPVTVMAPAVAAAASAAVSQALRDRQILDAVGTGAAALSLVGSSFIVLCYLLFRELRKFSFKLVFYLAVSDMFCSLFTILGGPSNAFYCFALDYSAHFFCVASFLWTTTIAFTLHRTVVKHKTDVEEFGSIFHLYVWGTSLATTVLRSIGSDYGRPGSWCWIQQGSMAKVLHLITFYLPLWGAILYNGFTYYEVNRMLNNATRVSTLSLNSCHLYIGGYKTSIVALWQILQFFPVCSEF